MDHPKHEVNCFLSVQKRINRIVDSAWSLKNEAIQIVTKSKLGDLVTNTFCAQAATFTATHSRDRLIADLKIYVDGEDMGTFGNPSFQKIMEKSKPSPFGRGEDTVLDPDYRRGREIEAAHISFGDTSQQSAKQWLMSQIGYQAAETLFVGRSVKISLYKLAIYGKDGHFDWHRDTTHADNHHATVLVALNTNWTGGTFQLKSGEETVEIDMHTDRCPKQFLSTRNENADDSSDDAGYDSADDKSMQAPPEDLHIGFKFVVFYTDMEHKVEPVTDGNRLVLQFDVLVHDDEDEMDDTRKLIKDARLDYYRTFDSLERLFAHTGVPPCDDVFQEISQEISRLHAADKPITPVVLPLYHLYRWASISEAHLKGADRILYAELKESFRLILAPVFIFQQQTQEDEFEASCYPLPSKYANASRDDVLALKNMKNARIFLPGRYQLTSLGRTDYIDYTGNEAQVGEARYYGGAIFIFPTMKDTTQK